MENQNSRVNGITEGVIWKQILLFFFPILFGTLFQTLYNTVDAIIVGQFLGKEALAAVSGGTSIMANLIIGFFSGIASGATVIISQHFGAQNDTQIEKSLHTAIAMSIYSGLFVSIGGVLATVPLLKLIDTPEAIMPLATQYLHIYFGGALSLIVYNMGAGIFRAIGDSRHPLYFLIVGSFCNIFLDITFIAVLHRGVRGAAEATIISQYLSAFLTLIFLRKRTDSCKLKFSKMLNIDKVSLKFMLQLGLPGGIQSVMYNISNMLIQANVNHFGTDTAAAWASYSKLDVIFWMIVNAFGIAITTFVGQNYGAGKINRARKGVKECTLMTLGTAIFLSAIYYFFGQFGFMLFTNDKTVISIGMRILRTISPAFACYVGIEILSGACRGAGKTIIPTLFSVFGICGLRITWLSISWCTATIERVMYCYAISWTFVSILFLLYYNVGDVYSEKKKKFNLLENA